MPDLIPPSTSAPPPIGAEWVAVVFADVVLRRLLFGVILVMTAVVVGVAGAAFFTSFEAIRDFAGRSGGIRAEHAWLVPLLVDSFIFIASAADLWFTVTGAARSVDGWAQRTIIWSPQAPARAGRQRVVCAQHRPRRADLGRPWGCGHPTDRAGAHLRDPAGGRPPRGRGPDRPAERTSRWPREPAAADRGHGDHTDARRTRGHRWTVDAQFLPE